MFSFQVPRSATPLYPLQGGAKVNFLTKVNFEGCKITSGPKSSLDGPASGPGLASGTPSGGAVGSGGASGYKRYVRYAKIGSALNPLTALSPDPLKAVSREP